MSDGMIELGGVHCKLELKLLTFSESYLISDE